MAQSQAARAWKTVNVRAVASPSQLLAPVMTTTLLSMLLLMMMTPAWAVIQAR
jgi:hypothetical protein